MNLAAVTLDDKYALQSGRVFLTGTMTSDVNDWLERHARRARRVTDMPGEIRPLIDAQAIFYAAPRRQWGTVLIDGVEIRNTPLSRYELPPGQYVVEVKRAGYQTTVDTVTITSGNPTILGKVLIH